MLRYDVSNEDLMMAISALGSKDFINDNFLTLLNMYPNLLDVALSDKYKLFFEKGVKNNFRNILTKITNDRSFRGYIYKLKNFYEKDILDNVDVILDQPHFYIEDFTELVNLNGFEECAQKNQEKILKRALEFNEYKFPTDYTSNLLFLLSALPFFEKDFAQQNKEKIENFINTHFNLIDPECFEDSRFLLNALTMSSKNHKFINEFVNKHLEFIAVILSNRKLKTLKEEKILDFYVELIKDVMRIEQASIEDLKLKIGSFSRTLIIKNKVIKSGEKNTKLIPYHKRLLQPIVRQRIKHEYHDFSKLIGSKALDFDFVEVYERVDEVYPSEKNLLYEVFKEMLEDGVLWTDPRLENIGKLLKPNLPFHETIDDYDKPFYIDDEIVEMYNPFGKKEILQKGDAVVLDLDGIYDIKDFNLKEYLERNLTEGKDVTGFNFRKTLKERKIEFFYAFDIMFDKYVKNFKNDFQNNKRI